MFEIRPPHEGAADPRALPPTGQRAPASPAAPATNSAHSSRTHERQASLLESAHGGAWPGVPHIVQPARSKAPLSGSTFDGLRSSLAAIDALPAGKFAPSLMVLADGRRLVLSSRLAHGTYGKFRLGVMDGVTYGVKELRTPAQNDGRRAHVRLSVTEVTGWAEAAREIHLLTQAFADLRAEHVVYHRGRLLLLMEAMQTDLLEVSHTMTAGHLPPSLRLGPALTMLADTGASLARTHGSGWVHRDLKPDNLFLAGDGHVRVGDLGLASALSDGARLSQASGTPTYIAPEVWAGAPASCAADVWGLGMTFVEVLTGRHPLELPAMRWLSISARLSRWADVHGRLPRNLRGEIVPEGLRADSADPLEAFLGQMHVDFGREVAGGVLNFMLHPDPKQRETAEGLEDWARWRLGSPAAAPAEREALLSLGAPDDERLRQSLALQIFAQHA